MEIKINREIRLYKESVFFGLSVRQFVCTLLAVTVAMTVYFTLHAKVSSAVSSWACIASAVPFAFLGFFTYHGMTAEQFAAVFLKSVILERKVFLSKPVNIYRELLR